MTASHPSWSESTVFSDSNMAPHQKLLPALPTCTTQTDGCAVLGHRAAVGVGWVHTALM